MQFTTSMHERFWRSTALPVTLLLTLILCQFSEQAEGGDPDVRAACTWQDARLKAWGGAAHAVKLCIDANGRPAQISSGFYPGEPRMDALAALMGFPAGSCTSNYDMSSGGSLIECEGDRDGKPFSFSGTINGPPGALTLYGAVSSHSPIAVFDSGSSK